MIEVRIGQPRQIGGEDGLKLLGSLLDNGIQNQRLGVGHPINFPEILVQLRQGQLNGGFRRVDVYRGQFCGGFPGSAELIGKHEVYQL